MGNQQLEEFTLVKINNKTIIFGVSELVHIFIVSS